MGCNPLPRDELALLERAGPATSVRLLRSTERSTMDRSLDHVVQGNTAQLAYPAFVRELKSWVGFNGPDALQLVPHVQRREPQVRAPDAQLSGHCDACWCGGRQGQKGQSIITRRPGFLWDARISLLPGVRVPVVDSCIASKGLLRAAAQGLFTVADVQGEGEVAGGECIGWFAEVAWHPTARLPSQSVRWEAVDDHSTNATVVDAPTSLTPLFRFNEAGLISPFRAESRGGMVGDAMVMAPWEGLWSNYQMRNGMQVPFTGEVAWMRPEGRKAYFIGTVTGLAFAFSP